MTKYEVAQLGIGTCIWCYDGNWGGEIVKIGGKKHLRFCEGTNKTGIEPIDLDSILLNPSSQDLEDDVNIGVTLTVGRAIADAKDKLTSIESKINSLELIAEGIRNSIKEFENQ